MKRVRTKEQSNVLPILPIEMWGEILSFLRLRDLFRCAIVCLQWHHHDLVNQSIRSLKCEESEQVPPERLRKMLNLVSLKLHYCERRRITRSNNHSAIIRNDAVCNALKMLVKLKKLNIEETQLICDDDIRSLTNLTSLRLDRSLISNAGLARLSCLTFLDIGYFNNTITDDGLQQLTNLRCLTITTQENITDNGISSLVNLIDLVILMTNDPEEEDFRLTERVLKRLTNLKCLGIINNTSITDDGLRPLINLEKLALHDNTIITSAGLNKLTSLSALVTCKNSIDTSMLRESIKVSCLKSNHII